MCTPRLRRNCTRHCHRESNLVGIQSNQSTYNAWYPMCALLPVDAQRGTCCMRRPGTQVLGPVARQDSRRNAPLQRPRRAVNARETNCADRIPSLRRPLFHLPVGCAVARGRHAPIRVKLDGPGHATATQVEHAPCRWNVEIQPYVYMRKHFSGCAANSVQ